MLKALIQKSFSVLPSSAKAKLLRTLLSTLNNPEKDLLGQNNLSIALGKAKRLGFDPSYVIDIGAHNGDWTNEVDAIYPSKPFLLIEALPTKIALLKQRFTGERFSIHGCLLGNEEKKDVPFFSMETGSSVLEELTQFPRETIRLDMYTLDAIARQHALGTNVFLKVDVQGFELEVLKGGAETLNQVEMLCLEVSLLNYNQGAPLIVEVIQALHAWGFVPYDFIGFFRKSTDGGLIQADMLFTKENSPLRQKVNRLTEPFKVIIQ